MGIGSYGICNDEQQAVCIDCMDFDDWDYSDIEHTILSILPPSYFETDGRDSDHAVIAQNGLYSVQITGHECDVGLRVKIIDSLEYDTPNLTGLAKANLDKSATKIFDALSQIYNLRVKTSGYTSAPYN